MRHETYVDHYEPICTLIPSKQKQFLLDYKANTGRDITYVIRQLVGRFMNGEITLQDQGTRPRKISSYQRGEK